MSHEIRTPMNGMMVMAELLAASPLSNKHLRYAQVISRSGRSLLNIINDILDMSKIEAGRLELEQTPFSIDELIEDTVSLFSARAREKGLTLSARIGIDVAGTVVGDPTRLGQVIANLTNNALKFTETGGVSIRVTTSAPAADGQAQPIRIEVTDTGIGIPDDKIDTVFEQFSQADQSTTRKFGGTGLGLPISRKLVEAMDGAISVTSTPDVGSTFAVEICLPHQDKTSGPGKALPAAGMTALILDDNPISRRATEEMLTDRGLTVLDGTGAEHAAEARIIFAHTAQMAAIGSRSLPAPVIMLTGYGDEGTADIDGANIAADVSLPLTRGDADLICQCLETGDFSTLSQTQSDASKVEFPSFAGLSVLAVDDDAVNREVLNEALTSLGIDAKFACSGEEGIAAAESNRFDLIFMDGSMPGMDGYEATAIIRKSERERGRSRPGSSR